MINKIMKNQKYMINLIQSKNHKQLVDNQA